jgi:hypothetical protein
METSMTRRPTFAAIPGGTIETLVDADGYDVLVTLGGETFATWVRGDLARARRVGLARAYEMVAERLRATAPHARDEASGRRRGRLTARTRQEGS